MFKTKKKGFTLVELVIVIAVIAILAAVLVPTFSNVIQASKVSKDKVLVRNLNLTAVAAEKNWGVPETVTESVRRLEREGLAEEDFILTSRGTYLVYDLINNRYSIYDTASKSFIFYDANFEIDISTPEARINYWRFDDKTTCTEDNLKDFSIYLFKTCEDTTVNVSTGIDVGNNKNITTINYSNNLDCEVTICTNSTNTTLNIDAPYNTINHYGAVGKVDIARIDMNCYYEKGQASYVKVTEGKVVASAGGIIDVVFANNTDGSKVAVIKETNAIINTGYTSVEATHTVNVARPNGIGLTYSIDGISASDFVEFVEATADYAVSTAQEAEKEAEKYSDPNSLPTGYFEDPFVDYDPGVSAVDEDVDIVINRDYASTLYIVIEDDEIYVGINDSFQFADVVDLNANVNALLAHDDSDSECAGAELEDVTSSDQSILFVDFNDMTTDQQFEAKKNGKVTVTFSFDCGDELELVILVVGDSETGNTCKIGGTEYAKLGDAFTAATNGQTITLIRDISLGTDIGSIIANNDKTITLDLNGHYISTPLWITNISVNIIDSSEDQTGKVDIVTFSCADGVHDDITDELIEDWRDRPAKLTLIGGSYKQIDASWYGIVEIAGAKIYNSDVNDYAIQATGASQSNIIVKSGIVIGRLTETRLFNSFIVLGGIFNTNLDGYLAQGYMTESIGGGMVRVIAK